MRTIHPFSWRPVLAEGALSYLLDSSAALLLSDLRTPDAPPFASLGGHPIAADGFAWTQATSGKGWMLSASGPPVRAHHVLTRYDELACLASALAAIDERILLAMIASDGLEDGQVVTLDGYPSRQDENDPGDPARDAQDFAASGGVHAVHGILMTTVAAAREARPKLFEGHAPSDFRAILADPVNALACGVAKLARFPAEVRADPVALRLRSFFGSSLESSLQGDASDFALGLLASFVASWNDEVRVRAGESVPAAPAPLAHTKAGAASGPLGLSWTQWSTLGLGVAAVGTGAYFLGRHKSAEVDLDDEDEDEEDLDDEGDEDDEDDEPPARPLLVRAKRTA